MTSYADNRKNALILPDGNLADSRDELYCRVYAHTFDRAQAFTAIGLNPGKRGNWVDTGRDYLRYRKHINARVRELVAERVQDLCIDENWVMLKLLQNLERAMEAEEKVDDEGERTGKFTYDGRTATKSLEMIGTQLGMFERNKQQQQGGVSIVMNFGGDAKPISITDGKIIESDE